MAMTNDGTKTYEQDTDGTNQQIGGCLRDFRNRPFPVRAKIEYYQNVLTVLFNSGNTNSDDEYELCLRVENVILPPVGHFGISAATGGLADDHDVLKFLTFSLQDPSQIKDNVEDDKEKEKYAKEYEDYKQKLEKQKDEYLKQHPGEADKMRQDPSEEYESLGEREFQQILQAQGQIHDIMKNLNHKLDEILGRQERSLSMLTLLQNNAYAQPHVPPAGIQQQVPHPAVLSPPMQRHEFESLFAQQQEVVSNTRQLKQSILNIANTPQQQPASVQQASQFNQQLLQETRDGVNTLRQEFSQMHTQILAQRSAQPLQQPSCPSCLTTTTFVVTIGLHLVIVIGYLFWKGGKDNQSKKFY